MNITYNKTKRSFWDAVSPRVEAYFRENKLSKTGNGRLYVKSAVLLTSAFILYWCLLYVPMLNWLALVCCALFGINFALIGFNIMHDASHKCYSAKKWVNEMMSFTLEMMGCSSFLWYIKHVRLHHIYTNVDGADDDLNVKPFLHFLPDGKARKFHRYQHIYAWLYYLTLYLYWVLFTDFKKYFGRKICNEKIKKIRVKDHITFWSGKLFHGTFMVFLPIYNFGWLPWLCGYLVFTASCGFLISLIFQLAHVVETSEFPVPDKEGVIQDTWARKQVLTTSNFATKSVVAFWLLGGLNYQVVHHLFRDISHVHYQAISPIIEETCKEYELPYPKPSFKNAVKSHFYMLKECGKSKKE